MTDIAQAATRADVVSRGGGKRVKRVALHAFLAVMSVVWLSPILWALYTSLRPFKDTGGDPRGYTSIGGAYNFQNYVDAWTQGHLVTYFINTMIILVPALILVLLLASMMAFAISRYSWRFNAPMLMLFTAANLLPPQVILTPLFRIYLALPLPAPLSDNGIVYNQYIGIMAIHVAFQLGFCTFVLSNYMKTLPKELNEAAVVDGAGVFRTYWSVILPLTRPALGALATLQFTWIYNDFFWALTLLKSSTRFPITTAINSLQGEFFTNYNLVAAASMTIAIPTLIVFFALQKQFISGLTLGSTKG